MNVKYLESAHEEISIISRQKTEMSSICSFKKALNEEHAGFAVTLEVLATLSMICVFVNFILYFLRVMDTQRYMNTVMTSTAAQASRWGGTNTKAYSENISSTPLITTSQQQLNYVAADFNAVITGSPAKITYDSQPITISIRYSLPSVFSTMSKVNGVGGSYDMYRDTRDMRMSVTVNSIMEAGNLL